MNIAPSKLTPLITFFAIFILLIWLTILYPPGYKILIPSLIFLILIVFTSVFSAPLVGGMASLTPMVTVAGYLLIGLIPSGWVAFFGAVIYAIARNRFSKQLGVQREVNRGIAVSLAAANITAKTVSILAGGVLYQYAGGVIPLVELNQYLLMPLVLLGLGYFTFNDLIFGSYIAAWEARSFHLSSRLVYSSIVFEGLPLIFSPVIALIYTNIGNIAFILACFAVMAIAVITRNLAFASYRLERRLRELESLQEVGQVLSTSLDLETILMAVYTQVADLMTADLFYVALLDENDSGVLHPLTIKDGEQVAWSSQYDEQGVVEYIMKTHLPNLSRESTAVLRDGLKLSKSQRTATSWLGVPMIAGDELLGVIIVQSFSSYDLYDLKHQEILVTIAAQAAVAIQNARLYERTDEALKSRVQELDSILRTVGEGVLLADLNFKVLTVNRALTLITDVHRSDIVGESLLNSTSMEADRLMNSIGYASDELLEDCDGIIAADYEIKRHIYSVETPIEKRFERTLTPVRDLDGNITAWLLVLRDVTEEFEVTRLRDDMMHTLVHDLRSPLAVVKGSLEVIRFADEDGKQENIDELMRLALIGTERMLRLINNLLDVSRLEDGQMVVAPSWISIEPILKNAVNHVLPEAKRVDIVIETSTEEEIPPIYVDQAHLERILNNLLDNAIKFTPDGGHVKISAMLDPDFTPASIVFGVSDTGPGIPEEIHKQLFQKYKQVKMIQGRRTGSGVGLYYCKLAVEAHGGQIWVESQVGSGSTFYFRLPLAP
ncbi:MAG: GAF domain-containing protein [Anaerolineales bacterium]|nr:GAF domain-containing protein [Anaerolineales bacterium]